MFLTKNHSIVNTDLLQVHFEIESTNKIGFPHFKNVETTVF